MNTEDTIRHVFAAKRAEELRREAIRLAIMYGKLTHRHHLDPEIVRNDAQAVVDVWSSADMNRHLRTAMAVAALRPCLLCGSSADAVGVFAPDEAHRGDFNAPEGKQRLFFYSVCSACMSSAVCAGTRRGAPSGMKSPPMTLRAVLYLQRRERVDFPQAWERALSAALLDAHTSERKEWKATLLETRSEWHAAYLRDSTSLLDTFAVLERARVSAGSTYRAEKYALSAPLGEFRQT